MLRRIVRNVLTNTLLSCSFAAAPLFAQEPTAPPPITPPPAIPAESAAPAAAPAQYVAPTPAPASAQLVVPKGTRLPLILRNTVNTRTAKPGDSVYFETVYPITANNRMAIPMGTFMRGEILAAKRPGRIKGRGELRLALRQMTFLNGYTIDLLATPSSVDPNTGAGVDTEGKITGPSSALRDTTAVLLSTAGGAYVGSIAGGVVNDSPGRGALIGGGAGGIGGLIAVLATRGPEAELPRGTILDVVFDRPLILDASYLPANAGPGIDPQPRYAAYGQQDAHARQRDERRRHSGSSMLLPFLLFPLLR